MYNLGPVADNMVTCSLHTGLKEIAMNAGAEINLNTAVTSVDPVAGTISFEDGTSVQGDVVIGKANSLLKEVCRIVS